MCLQQTLFPEISVGLYCFSLEVGNHNHRQLDLRTHLWTPAFYLHAVLTRTFSFFCPLLGTIPSRQKARRILLLLQYPLLRHCRVLHFMSMARFSFRKTKQSLLSQLGLLLQNHNTVCFPSELCYLIDHFLFLNLPSGLEALKKKQSIFYPVNTCRNE